ncbi:MAG: extracellular solute-binding protein [Chthonomonadaceae bacterium]|nr:extracellular solute-binding protein [Chthonomonadaceae bacterium]
MTRRELLALAALAAVPGCLRPEQGVRTLRLANWGAAGDESEFYKQVLDIYRRFEAHHGVRLSVEGTPNTQDYVSKLLLDHVSESMPDIVTLDASSAAVFINNGILSDLSPLIRSDKFDLDHFFPNVVDIARRGHEVYALPTDFTPMVVYANARHFREAGVELPRGTWSFESFRDIAVRLTRNGRFGFEFTNWMPGWVMFLWNFGADVLSPDGQRCVGHLDSSLSIEAIQFLADLVLRDQAAPSLSQAAAAGVDYFATGRASLKVSGHWYLVGLDASKDIDMADVLAYQLPTRLHEPSTVMYESGLAIAAKSRNKDLAWEYLKYFSSHEVQSAYQRSGIAVCARRDVAKENLNFSSFYLGQQKEGVEAAKRYDAAKHQRNATFQSAIPRCRRPWGATVEGYDRIEDLCQKAMDAILKNGANVQDALRDAASNIDKELASR